MSEASKTKLRFSISLRFLLTLMVVLFIVGYQQYQVHQLRKSVDELTRLTRDMSQELKQRSQPVIFTRVAPTKVPGGGNMYFPMNVERAMMGDAFQLGKPPAVTPIR